MPEMKTLTVNGVKYDLRDASAAPAGYGLGDGLADYSVLGDANTATKTGWYRISSSTANCIGAAGMMRVEAYSDEYCVQTAIRGTTGKERRRTLLAGVWSEWDWIHPTMSLGTEYRTVERYRDEPVYVKTFAYTPSSTIGNASGVTNTLIPHDISDFKAVVRIYGIAGIDPLPIMGSTGGSISINSTNASGIELRTYNMTMNATVYITIYYTKTS